MARPEACEGRGKCDDPAHALRIHSGRATLRAGELLTYRGWLQEVSVSTRMVRVGLLAGVSSCAGVACTGCGAKPTYTSGGRTASYWAELLEEPDVEMRRKRPSRSAR